MKCPKCETDNPSGSKYCRECATRFDSSGRISFTKTLETTTEELIRGSVFAGRYEIIEVLGTGGMGRVYRAEDKKIKGEIALKLIKLEVSSDKRTIERFSNELKTTRMISHRNVCRMFDLGEDKGTYFIAMEYVPGEDLKSLIHRIGALPIGKAVSIAGQVCEGLAEAHRLGVVHRDLKPGNIMIDKDGNAKIMDFGIARSLHAKGLTGEGVIIGTPEYMSPEQVEAKAIDQRSDIYSLGIILYEMLTGRTPFEGETPLSIAMKHKGEAPRNPREFNPQIPDGLSRLILRCLEKDKEKRYQTSDEVRSELEGTEKSVPPAEKISPAKRPRTSREITVTFKLKKLLLPAAIGVAAIVALWLIFLKPPAARIANVSESKAISLIALPAKVLGLSDYAYLTDGIPGTLSTFLGQIEGLNIKAPPSSLEVDKVRGDLGIIAGLYQVDIFVVTSVTAESGLFYLDVKLVDARTRDQRWSKQLNGVSGQYLEMVHRAAEDIRQYLRPVAPSIISAGGTAVNSEVELALQRGGFFSNRYRNNHKSEDFDLSMAAFRQAIQLDPKMAVAYAEIAVLLLYKTGQVTIQKPAFLEIESWARKALNIDLKCGPAWGALALLEDLLPELNWKKSLEFALKAASFSPRSAVAHNRLFGSGQALRLDILCVQEAVQLDPFQITPVANLSLVYCPLGRAEESLTYIERSLQVEPNAPFTSCPKSIALIYLSRLKEAAEPMKLVEGFVKEEKLGPIWLTIVKHAFLIQENDPAKEAATLTEIRKTVDEMFASGMELGNYILFIPPLLARHGHEDLAFHILEKSVDTQPFIYDFFDLSPDLRRIKEDPRAANIRARCRPEFEEVLKVYVDARRRGELPKYLEKPLEEIMKEMKIKLLP